MDPRTLIETARSLTELDKRRPRQANLRRAASTAYYALFHSLACAAANLFIGKLTGGNRSEAWHQVYRALEHGKTKNACANEKAMAGFSSEIQDFAQTFIALQSLRHRADYSLEEKFDKLSTLAAIDMAKNSIAGFEKAHDQDCRGFVAHVLFKRRSP